MHGIAASYVVIMLPAYSNIQPEQVVDCIVCPLNDFLFAMIDRNGQISQLKTPADREPNLDPAGVKTY